MTERQIRFVDAYLRLGNATAAAKVAGYSERTAGKVAHKLMLKAEIRERIDERLKELEDDRIAEVREVLIHLSAVLRGELTEEIVTPSGKRFVVAVAEHDRLRAADFLLKVNGAYREKTNTQVDTAELYIATLEKIWSEQTNTATATD